MAKCLVNDLPPEGAWPKGVLHDVIAAQDVLVGRVRWIGQEEE